MQQTNTLTDVQEQVVDATKCPDEGIAVTAQDLQEISSSENRGISEVKPVQSPHENKAAKAARLQAQQESEKKLSDILEENIKLREKLMRSLEEPQVKLMPVPPQLGAVNELSDVQKDFYTPEEVDKLTDRDLSNPKIMKRVQYSMTKWN
ncbi:MAG: hypothetical protein RR497_04570 [Oscillospiraceae bacterium]